MKYLLSFTLSFFLLSALAQSPESVIKKLGNNPVFFIDSTSVDKNALGNYQPTEVASVSVYKDSAAIKLIGPAGRDGVVYIETKKFARAKYWTYFKSKSGEYAKIVVTPEADTAIQYVLNKRVLTSNFEGSLSLIDDKTFRQLTIVDKKTLESEYGITNKSIGVIIMSDVPDDLYKGKKKF